MIRPTLIPATVAAVALLPGMALAQQTESYRYAYGPHMGWDGGWYGMIFGPFFMILFLAIVIGLIVLLVRWLGGGTWPTMQAASQQGGRSPHDILKERYARGEIDKADFEERRRTLGE
ncbi:MAG TPA: SHOCT domain-containing protein [Aurantimonas sp.]|uniref:SHOCT domain-containing protein n=1 Tax=Aurantimonas marianensis TaxID=2920428 RepID=A0A9X2KIQ3_9HYPH|nr:SHOCT domain-containing protein [Aurantimonas marianensis]MCP3055842.1 SHOCT domain-containing protein [Aurantimonas marianensis]